MWDRQNPDGHGTLSTVPTPNPYKYNQVVVSPAWGLHSAVQFCKRPLPGSWVPSPSLTAASNPLAGTSCIPAAVPSRVP